MGVGQQEKPPISCETENRNKIELNKWKKSISTWHK